MAIKDWSTTPDNNNFSVVNGGCPENWAPSQVNNVLRIQMANHKEQWQNAEWFDRGDSGLSRASATSFKVTGDLTAEYLAGRRVKCFDATTLYATVASSSYGAPDTTVNVTMDSGTLSTSLSSVALGILRPTNQSIPVFNNISVAGTSSLSGGVTLKTTLNCEGAATISGATTLKTTLNVLGATTLSGTVTVRGITTIESATVLKTTLNCEGPATISGATTLKTTLNVLGATTLSGAVVCKSTLTVNGVAIGGGVVSKQIFTAGGTYTPTSGMKYCIAYGIGGGGGGGGCANTAAQQGAAGGGGSGGYGKVTLTAAQIGASQTVTIGAAGAAGAAGNNAGGNGGSTSLGTLLVVGGGTGGSGSAQSASANQVAGGAGGTATTGDVLIPGGTGGTGYAGAAVTINLNVSGYGANSLFGNGGIPVTVMTNTGVAGVAGTGYGSGGSGASNSNGGSTRAGGAGTAGIIIIEEFI